MSENRELDYRYWDRLLPSDRVKIQEASVLSIFEYDKDESPIGVNLDTLSYIVGLSGSTWAIGGWLSRDTSVDEFTHNLLSKVGRDLQDITAEESKLIAEDLFVKYVFKQKLTLVDLYGSLLANRLFNDFGNNRHRVYLSHQANKIKDGLMPLPLYSAVRRGRGVPASWFEFSPYEIGSVDFKSYIPTWAYGRKFDKAGNSIDFAPEKSLGYNLGTFGSAFAVDYQRAYDEMIAGMDPPKETIVKELFKKINSLSKGEVAKIGGKRINLSKE